MDKKILGAVGLLMCGTIGTVATISLGSMEETAKGAPRSSLYKGEVVLDEENKLIMKDSNGQVIELHLDPGTVIQGRPGARFRPGDFIEVDVTPEGYAKLIRPMR